MEKKNLFWLSTDEKSADLFLMRFRFFYRLLHTEKFNRSAEVFIENDSASILHHIPMFLPWHDTSRWQLFHFAFHERNLDLCERQLTFKYSDVAKNGKQ